MRQWLLSILIVSLSVLTSVRISVAASAERLAINTEAVANTFDGSVRSECTVQDEVGTGQKHETWIAFGKVKPQGQQSWEATSTSARCGGGSFDKANTLSGRGIGIPYLIIDIEALPTSDSPGKVNLQTTLMVRKLSAFDEYSQPIYTNTQQEIRSTPKTGESVIVPLFSADTHEQEVFNIRELFLQLDARVLGQKRATYGAISVTTDAPSLDIILDGGPVGRTGEEGPTVLRNIVVGKHELRVRDFSGRTTRSQVIVKKDQTAKVVLKLLNLPSSRTPKALVPIGKNLQGYEEYWRTRDKAVVVQIPAGEFLMGSSENEGEPAERPQRQVYVSAFLMDKTEVTWRQFRKFSTATDFPLPPIPLWGTPSDYAASNLLFAEAQAYCEWVGRRLPTEAEWEKAARDTDVREYPWGNEWDLDRCHSQDGAPHRPEDVGSFLGCLSPYGLLDMAGGVWEWSADWYADGYADGPARDPHGAETGDRRVLRGGAWHSMATWLRTAYRYGNAPDWRSPHNGIRCVQPALQ